MKVGLFKQILYKEILSLLQDCLLGMDTLSDWGTFPLPGIIKQKAYKFDLQAILIEIRNQ